MRHLVEGPDGVGKTVFARHLACRLGLPYYKDRTTGRLVTEGVDPNLIDSGQLVVFDLLDQVAANHDHVLDRGWLTAVVYSRVDLRRTCISPPTGRVDSYARKLGQIETIYAVTAPVEVALERVRSRGERHHDEDFARRVFEEFDRIYSVLDAAGISIIYVDGTRGKPPDWSLQSDESGLVRCAYE